MLIDRLLSGGGWGGGAIKEPRPRLAINAHVSRFQMVRGAMSLQVTYRYKQVNSDPAKRKHESIEVKRKFPSKVPVSGSN